MNAELNDICIALQLVVLVVVGFSIVAALALYLRHRRASAEPTTALMSKVAGRKNWLLFSTIGLIALVPIYYSLNCMGTPSSPHTPTDSTPPTIQSVSVSPITETSAVITWVTDEPATSQVMIYEPSSFATWTKPEEALVTNHSVTLSDLKPNTTYHFNIISKDASGNEAISEGELTTSAQADTTPPVISEVSVSNITESSATISWVTDEPATSQVEYGITGGYSSTISLGEKLATTHSVRLSWLEANTSYYFKVRSKDASGNEASPEGDRTFTTLPALPIGPEVGMRAPDFTLQTVDGESLTLSDFRGKIVMVNFWLSRCDPCIREMPYIRAVFEKWPAEELVILAINVRESTETVQSFIDSQGLTFPVLLDSEGVIDEVYDPPLFPTTFFIDSEGVIRQVKEGRFRSQQEIESILESL